MSNYTHSRIFSRKNDQWGVFVTSCRAVITKIWPTATPVSVTGCNEVTQDDQNTPSVTQTRRRVHIAAVLFWPSFTQTPGPPRSYIPQIAHHVTRARSTRSAPKYHPASGSQQYPVSEVFCWDSRHMSVEALLHYGGHSSHPDHLKHLVIGHTVTHRYPRISRVLNSTTDFLLIMNI